MKSRAFRAVVIIAGSFPSATSPTRGVFVETTAVALAEIGVKVTVINPIPFHDGRCIERINEMRFGVEILRPRFFSASTRRVGPVRLAVVTQPFFERAVRRAMLKTTVTPDAVYGHFMFPAGGAAVRLGVELERPSFVGVGEGRFWTLKGLGLRRSVRRLRSASGFVAVSQVIAEKLNSKVGIDRERIGLFPNGTDGRVFRPLDKRESRRELGIPDTEFVVVFVGGLVHSKGPHRVSQAVKGIEGATLLLAGEGPQQPSGAHIRLLGNVPHRELPKVLSAADVFALPTTHEGSCNAIVEAMACGLPIISSQGSFNDDLLEPDIGIRIDPFDVDSLSRALRSLKENPSLRLRHSRRSLLRAKELDVRARASRLVAWMKARSESFGAKT